MRYIALWILQVWSLFWRNYRMLSLVGWTGATSSLFLGERKSQFWVEGLFYMVPHLSFLSPLAEGIYSEVVSQVKNRFVAFEHALSTENSQLDIMWQFTGVTQILTVRLYLSCDDHCSSSILPHDHKAELLCFTLRTLPCHLQLVRTTAASVLTVLSNHGCFAFFTLAMSKMVNWL